MSNGVNPYGLAGIERNLREGLIKGQFGTREAKLETEERKEEDTATFERLWNRIQEEALRKANKNKGLFDIANFISLGLGPVGAGITSGLSSYFKGRQKQKGMKHLLNRPELAKYKGSHLWRPYDDYKTTSDKMQISSHDIFKDVGLKSMMAGLTSESLYGGEEGGAFGLIKRGGGLGGGGVRKGLMEHLKKDTSATDKTGLARLLSLLGSPFYEH
jgi:hypothetical protein